MSLDIPKLKAAMQPTQAKGERTLSTVEQIRIVNHEGHYVEPMQTNERAQGQHTPGPWRIDHSSIRASLDGEDVQIAAMFTTSWSYPDQGKNEKLRNQTEANARLIAQAPELAAQRDELLVALQSVISDLEHGTTSRWKGAGSASLRAAIERADKEAQS